MSETLSSNDNIFQKDGFILLPLKLFPLFSYSFISVIFMKDF